MKRRVLFKTTSLHVEKKKDDQNGVVLNDNVPLSSSPERAAGEERKVLFFLPLSLPVCSAKDLKPHAL